ncbi:putative yippee-like protein Os10g0369500 isoform X2 [Phragmites australis]|uniref:putative yippee-like protein Os10g0369500 isoform X2 n=1 Tax=Phragmites australis TaxID=29695 RepID=UPI002D777555|nr:putative yippee-like protein Os10g0369500 isoform X2 [Phragmites australis]
MGLLFVEVLPRDGGEPVLKCRRCRVDAASTSAIVSRDFQGRFGRAYLFDHVVNITLGPNEDRYLMTGLHTVNDIYCNCCQQVLGWRYDVNGAVSTHYCQGTQLQLHIKLSYCHLY